MTTPLQQAAQELIGRWDSPMWRYQQATTDVIAELRKALDAELAQSEPDCVARIVVFGKGWKLDYLSLPVGVHDLYARSFTYTQPQATTPAVEISESVIDEFLEDYEMLGESEDGRDACYVPTEGDKALIKDAVFGLLSHVSNLAAQGEKP